MIQNTNVIAKQEAFDKRKHGNSNSRKHLIPCFIQDILDEETDYRNHMTKSAIEKRLVEWFGISVSKRTINRHLKTMLDEPDICYVFGDDETGYYCDRDYYRPGRTGE